MFTLIIRFQEEYAKAYYAALMQRQQEASLSTSGTQLTVQQEDEAPDRVVGMKAKRESEEEEEEGVEWEESNGTKNIDHICVLSFKDSNQSCVCERILLS